jgi:molybdopterin-guanine dinucleotide biosynthesis protein A
MPQRFLSMTGFVLTGGASRRMGRPKSNLVIEGETMLARQVRLLLSVSRTVAVVGRVAGLEGLRAPAVSALGREVPLLPDELPGRGPLGGIYTGLLRTRTEFNLFLGCDLPLMEARFLRYLAARATACGADVTAPESSDHRLQPLVAVYRRRARAAVRSSLACGANKVVGFYRRVHCDVLTWTEIARAGFPTSIFANMNTPADYEKAVRRLNESVKCKG